MKYKVGDKVIVEENNKIKEGIIMQVDLYGYYIHLLPYDDNFDCLFFEEDKISRTNEQWLESLSTEEKVDWLINDYERLKFAFTQTRTGLMEWFCKKHD